MALLSSPNKSVMNVNDKKTKRLVSYDVFMKYVVFLSPGDVDVSGVFSKDCFEEWIANRKKRPKEPEESFRKALVAHVSGKDDRKPFDEGVEKVILQRLRESEPWPCFAESANGANKIGERGLKKSSLGFHESKRKRSSDSKPQKNAKKLHPCTSLDSLAALTVSPNLSFAQYPTHFNGYASHAVQMLNPIDFQGFGFPTAALGLNAALTMNGYGSYQYGAQEHQHSLEQFATFPEKHNPQKLLNSTREDKVDLILRKCLSTEDTISNSIAKGLAAKFSTAELKEFLDVGTAINDEMWTEEVLYEIDNKASSYPFCSKEFVLPEADQQKFNPTKPTGSLLLMFTTKIIEADENAHKILGGYPLKGEFLLSFFYNAVHRAVCGRTLLNQMSKQEVAWLRICTRTRDGSLKILLTYNERFEHQGKKFMNLSFQDISDQYLPMLERLRATLSNL